MSILRQGLIEYLFELDGQEISHTFESALLKEIKRQWKEMNPDQPLVSVRFGAWFPVNVWEEEGWWANIQLVARIKKDGKEYKGSLYFGFDLNHGGKGSVDFDSLDFTLVHSQ